MRKSKKIKASFIFLSWMMIFAHGIIPHSHHEDIPFYHGFHNKGCVEENSRVALKTHTENEDNCRISNLLFHKFSQEQNTVLSSGCASCLCVASWLVIYNNYYSFISGRYSDTESLRAPPRA